MRRQERKHARRGEQAETLDDVAAKVQGDMVKAPAMLCCVDERSFDERDARGEYRKQTAPIAHTARIVLGEDASRPKPAMRERDR